MATDEELQALAEQAVNPTDVNAPSPVQLAPVIGTPEGPGIPPIAPEPLQTQPVMPTPIVPPAASGGVQPAPGAPVVPTPAPLATPGLDMRAADLARESGHAQAQAAANKQPAIAQANEAEAKGHQDVADLENQQADDIEVERQAQAQGIKDAQQIADRAADEVKNFKFHDFFGDMATGQKIRMNIAYALGAYSASGVRGHGVNPVAEKIKMLVDNQYRMDKEALGTKQWVAQQKAKGVTDLRQAYQDDLEALKLKQSLALKAAGEEAKSYLIQQQTPLKEAENNELVQSLIKDADEKYSKTFEQMTRDKAMMALERARLANSQPEDPAKLALLAQLAQRPGVTQADLYAFAQRIGIRDANKAVIPIEKNPEAEQAARDKADKQLEQRTVFVNGQPVGYAPSSRVVKQMSDRAIQYEDAIKSLEDLKAQINGGSIPIVNRIPQGDAYNRAVLAVAATTTANASDKTTTHEANTIKNWGLLSTDAIDKTLEHLHERQKKFMGQLQPLGSEPGTSSNKSGGHSPGDRVIYKGKTYRVGSDGDSLEPL